MDEVTSDLSVLLLYQTELIIAPFTNLLIRQQSLSCPPALLSKQTRRQRGSAALETLSVNLLLGPVTH